MATIISITSGKGGVGKSVMPPILPSSLQRKESG